MTRPPTAIDRRQISADPLATQHLDVQDVVELTGYSIPELALLRGPGGAAADADNAGLVTFLLTAKRLGLDPLKRQCYWIKRAGKWTFQTGIDGFSAIADRTNKFAGIDPVEYRGHLDVKDPKNPKREIDAPEEAEATVWKLVGQTEQVRPFRAKVHWREYYPGDELGWMWRDMPRRMLGKCAIAQAMRIAFPEQLGEVDLVDDDNQRGRVLDVTEAARRPRPAAAPQLNPGQNAPEQPERPKRTYEDVFETEEDDRARRDRETAQAHQGQQVAARAKDAAQLRDQQLLEMAEADEREHARQQREEGVNR